MIYGIGTDIVRVARMQENLDKHGDRFAKRILSDNEFKEFQKTKRQANFLAKRFAAKEATAKAMGTGFNHGLSLRHIGVGHDELGKPLLELSDAAEKFVQDKCITSTHISLADESEYAVAYVILQN